MNPVAPVEKQRSTKISVPGNGRGGHGGDGGFSRGPGGNKPADKFQAKQLGLWLFLATVVMFFAAITSSLIIRRSAPDWKPIFFPSVLWLNTGLLLLSSLTLEISRRSLKKSWESHRAWLAATTVLGFAFLAGQVYAWGLMARHGLFLPTSPHSSFFYLITCLHGLHLLGGIVWLTVANAYAARRVETSERQKSLGLMATYWHFMDLLWIYLFVLLLIM